MNQTGDTLVSVLIATSVGLIVTIGMASMLSGNQREVSSLHRQIYSLQNESLLMQYLNPDMPNNICTCHLNPTINTTEAGLHFSSLQLPAKMTLKGIRKNCNFAVTDNFFVNKDKEDPNIGRISEISVSIDKKVDTSVYEGSWNIAYESSIRQIPIKPIKIPMAFLVDTSNPASAFVSSCKGNGGALAQTCLSFGGVVDPVTGKCSLPSAPCNWNGERAVYGNGGGCNDDLYVNCSGGKVIGMRWGC